MGSMTTRTAEPPSPKATVPRSSETAVNSCPAACGRLEELDEDGVLAEAVDHKRVVPALADPLVAGALLDAGVLVEDGLLGLHGPPKSPEPLLGGGRIGHRGHASASGTSARK